MPTSITAFDLVIWFIFWFVAGPGWSLGSAFIGRLLR